MGDSGDALVRLGTALVYRPPTPFPGEEMRRENQFTLLVLGFQVSKGGCVV